MHVDVGVERSTTQRVVGSTCGARPDHTLGQRRPMQRSARPTDRPRLGMSPIRSRILPRRARRKATHGSRCRVPQICTHVVDAAIYTLHYDVVKDFEPIALLAKNPVLFLAKNAVPANDLTGLIAWLKVSPDKALFG